MPNRILKESICYSDDLDCLTAFEEIVFYRLLVRVDDYGRLDARPAFLRSQLFTTRSDIAEEKLCAAVDRLAEVGLIQRYSVDDKPYLYIVSWQKHQRLRCSKEKYPAPSQTLAQVDKPLPQPAATCRRQPPMAARAGAESESESQSESESENQNKMFIPPTVAQVAAYCRARHRCKSLGQRLLSFLFTTILRPKGDGSMPKKRPDADTPSAVLPQPKPAGCDGDKENTATAAEVLRELTDIGLGRRAFTATDRQGNTVDHAASVPERIRALELLAKYHKLTASLAESAVTPVKIVDDLGKRRTKDKADHGSDRAKKCIPGTGNADG